jgi:hypothetical protein
VAGAYLRPRLFVVRLVCACAVLWASLVASVAALVGVPVALGRLLQRAPGGAALGDGDVAASMVAYVLCAAAVRLLGVLYAHRLPSLRAAVARAADVVHEWLRRSVRALPVVVLVFGLLPWLVGFAVWRALLLYLPMHLVCVSVCARACGATLL